MRLCVSFNLDISCARPFGIELHGFLFYKRRIFVHVCKGSSLNSRKIEFHKSGFTHKTFEVLQNENSHPLFPVKNLSLASIGKNAGKIHF